MRGAAHLSQAAPTRRADTNTENPIWCGGCRGKVAGEAGAVSCSLPRANESGVRLADVGWGEHGWNVDCALAILFVSFLIMPLDYGYTRYKSGRWGGLERQVAFWPNGTAWSGLRAFAKTLTNGRGSLQNGLRVGQITIDALPRGCFFHSRDRYWLRDTEGLVRNGACIVQHGTPQ